MAGRPPTGDPLLRARRGGRGGRTRRRRRRAGRRGLRAPAGRQGRRGGRLHRRASRAAGGEAAVVQPRRERRDPPARADRVAGPVRPRPARCRRARADPRRRGRGGWARRPARAHARRVCDRHRSGRGTRTGARARRTRGRRRGDGLRGRGGARRSRVRHRWRRAAAPVRRCAAPRRATGLRGGGAARRRRVLHRRAEPRPALVDRETRRCRPAAAPVRRDLPARVGARGVRAQPGAGPARQGGVGGHMSGALARIAGSAILDSALAVAARRRVGNGYLTVDASKRGLAGPMTGAEKEPSDASAQLAVSRGGDTRSAAQGSDDGGDASRAPLAGGLGPRLGPTATFATTEHFNLQTARALTVSEANGRASIYLAALSGNLIALAFVGQMSRLGAAFYAFALILLPVLAFVGVVTFLRLVQSSIEDIRCAHGIALLRSFCCGVWQIPEPYLVAVSGTGSPVPSDLKKPAPGAWQLPLTAAGMVAVVNSVVMAACAGLMLEAAGVH